MTEIIVELIKLIPSLLWFAFLVGFIVVFFEPIKNDLFPKISTFKAMGVELNFMHDSISSAVDNANARDNSEMTIADKAPQWKINVPEKDKRQAIKRVRQHLKLFSDAFILWVDDVPANNINERGMFKRLNTSIDVARSTDEALEKLQIETYDIIISDMERYGNQKAGIEFLDRLIADKIGPPLVFYLGYFDPAKGTPPGAFGITNRPDQLVHLILDVLERKHL